MNKKEINRRKAILRRLARKYGDFRIMFKDSNWFEEEADGGDCIACFLLEEKRHIILNSSNIVEYSLERYKVAVLHEVGHLKNYKYKSACMRWEVDAERFVYEKIKEMKDPILFCEAVHHLQDFKYSPWKEHRKAYKHIRNFPEKYSFDQNE